MSKRSDKLPSIWAECRVTAISVYTDASGTGGDGFTKESANSDVYVDCDSEEQNENSTFEYLVSQKLFSWVKDRKLLWHADNQNCVRIIDYGSTNSRLHGLAVLLNAFSRLRSL